MKTYKIDPLGKNRPLMLVRGTRLPESFPDSVAEHMAKSLKANCRGVFATINGEISSSTAHGVVLSREANEDNNTLVVLREGMQNVSVDWEDSTGKQFRLEHAGRFAGSQYGGHDPYYTGAYKDLRNFVTGAVPYTGQPLVAANAKQWYSYTTPEGVALTFRGCIQAPVKEGTDFVGLKIDSITLLSSDRDPSFKLTLDCDSAVSLGLRNGMNDDSKPFNMRPGIGWLQIVATDDFKSHIKGFSESTGNGDANIIIGEAYDGFTYNVDLAAIVTQPGGWVSAGNNASFRIYVKSGSALEDSIIANASGYACEKLGFDMSGSGDTFPWVEEVSPTLNAEPTVVNLTTNNRKQVVVIRFSSVQDGEQLHLDLSDTVTAQGFLHFCSMNTDVLGAEFIDSGKKSFVIDIPRGDDVFAFFVVDYNAAGTLTFSRTEATLATVQDKVRNDLEDTNLLSRLSDNFEVVTLTGEDQIVEGSVRDDANKISKVFVVPAGEGGFRTNMTCWSCQLNKKADGTYSTTINFNYPISVNNSSSGSEFNKVSDTDVYLVPLGFANRFELVARTAEQMRTDEELVQTATTPHVSADQVLADVLAACGTDRSTADARNAFEHKITGFDVSNSGDYIYVNAADVKNMYLNGNAWFEIISKTGEQYQHKWLSEAISDGTTTIETILRYRSIPVEGTSIFIAKRYGNTCTLLVSPPPTPGFYNSKGQLIKAMTKEEVEQDHNFDSRPVDVNDAVKNATKFVWPDGVTRVGASVFNGCSGLTSITIPSTVTSIGMSAFRGCSDLTSVTIPNTVTTIGEYAFANCLGLTSVTIPEGVTKVGAYAFSGCSGLTSVTIPEGVTTIGYAVFSGCPSLTSVTIPNTVTVIGDNAFSGCSGLTSVTIPNTVTEIGNAVFYDCSGLTSVTIPNTVTEISNNAFSGCTSLNPLTVPNTVTTIRGDAFKDVPKVIYGGQATGSPWGALEVVAPKSTPGFYDDGGQLIKAMTKEEVEADYNFKSRPATDEAVKNATNFIWPEGVTKVGANVFYGCTGLTSITIPEGVTKVGAFAFDGCSGLTSVTLPSTVTSIEEYAFSGCPGLTSVTIPEGVTTIGNSAFAYCSGLTSVTIPEGVTTIGTNVFYGCTSLNPLTVPNTVTTIGHEAFKDVPKVIYGGTAEGSPWGAKEVVPPPTPGFYNSEGQLIKAMTKEEVEKSYDYDNYPAKVNDAVKNATNFIWPEGVTRVGNYAFDSCTGLTEVEIPEGVTSIEGSAFSGCSSLASVTIPEGVTTIGYKAFDSCSSLASVTIPEGVTDVGNYAFSGCSALTSVTIPSTVTSIGERAFNRCTGLTSVTIPEGVTTIGNSTFYGCTSLTSVTIPEGVTKVDDYAFGSCTSLASVTIPEGVTTINWGAFEGCTSLNPLTVPNTVTTIGKDAFKDVPKVIYSGTAEGSPWGALEVSAS